MRPGWVWRRQRARRRPRVPVRARAFQAIAGSGRMCVLSPAGSFDSGVKMLREVAESARAVRLQGARRRVVPKQARGVFVHSDRFQLMARSPVDRVFQALFEAIFRRGLVSRFGLIRADARAAWFVGRPTVSVSD